MNSIWKMTRVALHTTPWWREEVRQRVPSWDVVEALKPLKSGDESPSLMVKTCGEESSPTWCGTTLPVKYLFQLPTDFPRTRALHAISLGMQLEARISISLCKLDATAVH
jgi:hypothetical protein